MKPILLNVASESASIDNMTVPIFIVGQLIVFVGTIIGIYYTLKNKNDMNTQSITSLKEDLNREIESNKEKITEMKTEHNESYRTLDSKVDAIDKEVSGIAGGISEIKGYMKAMADAQITK